MRAGKGTPYEGGVRTPLIISGLKIPKGKVVNESAITMDVFSTILDIINVQTVKYKIDGVSLLPAIKGKTDISLRFPEKSIELDHLLKNWLKETNAQFPTPNASYDPLKQKKGR